MLDREEARPEHFGLVGRVVERQAGDSCYPGVIEIGQVGADEKGSYAIVEDKYLRKNGRTTKYLDINTCRRSEPHVARTTREGEDEPKDERERKRDHAVNNSVFGRAQEVWERSRG